MNNWLRCTVYLGQFENELGVDAMQFDDTPFTLFAPLGAVKLENGPPTKDKPANGYLAVEILEQKGELVLLRLPRQTFQGGPYVTVKIAQLKDPPASSPRKAGARK